MLKLLFFLFILFLFITVYSFKKRIDGILDTLFPSKEARKGSANSNEMEELVRCANCGVYVPKSQAVRKLRLKQGPLYFCSDKCKEEYKN